MRLLQPWTRLKDQPTTWKTGETHWVAKRGYKVEVLQHPELQSVHAILQLKCIVAIARHHLNMDLLNAVGIASGVVQFAGHGFRLITDLHELYKCPSGQKSEYIELSIISQDLSHLANAIKAKFNGDQEPGEKTFIRLHGECMETNDELQDILNKLKLQGTTKIKLVADGLRVAFGQIAAAGDIEKLADRLSQIREQMNVALMYLLLSVTPPFYNIWHVLCKN